MRHGPVGAGVGDSVGPGVGAGVGGSTAGARVCPTLAGCAVENSVGEGVGSGGLVSPGAWAASEYFEERGELCFNVRGGLALRETRK